MYLNAYVYLNILKLLYIYISIFKLLPFTKHNLSGLGPGHRDVPGTTQLVAEKPWSLSFLEAELWTWNKIAIAKLENFPMAV